MQDLPHNGTQRHLCELYQNLPPRPRRGVHSPRQIFLWLRGRHSEQPVSLTGRAHPGHGHTLWLCRAHRISHAASQLTSADLTHTPPAVCLRRDERLCASVGVAVYVCVCACVCSAVTFSRAAFSGYRMRCCCVWVSQCSALGCLGLKSEDGSCCGLCKMRVVNRKEHFRRG